MRRTVSQIYDILPPDLYGELSDDIYKILSTDPNSLLDNATDHFKSIIYKHLDKVKSLHCPKSKFFAGNMYWLNTSKNLLLDEDLNNKILVLDFFTFCCINCIHVLPYLKQVEAKYVDKHEVVVIGIHSPKFPNEKNLVRVLDALIRNDIRHPVVNDSEKVLWNGFNISCWPTVVILGPNHELLFVLMGESEINKLPFLISHVVEYFQKSGDQLNITPLPITPFKYPVSKFHLLYPGGISAFDRLVLVSDTAHNRFILFTLDGRIMDFIGTGKTGCNDGPFNKATFNFPHGTVWKDSVVYVADTGNHCIRKIDMQEKCVTTVFKMNEGDEFTYGDTSEEDCPTLKTKFYSPWDVCIGPKLGSTDEKLLNTLYIAVAGSHQIWAMDLDSEKLPLLRIGPFAGSGEEENRSNTYRLRAGFAQPSGIDYSPVNPFQLFVADSESSTIRVISLHDGAVKRIVGGGLDPKDLFQFGDVDGACLDVKLQHPMSVCVVDENTLVVTDTYNHKLKVIKIRERFCFAYEPQGSVEFCEPSAICYIDGTFFVADTNNHCIERIQIAENKAEIFSFVREEVQKFEIENVKSIGGRIPENKVEIKFGGQVRCMFDLEADPNYVVNKKEHQPWDVSIRGEGKFVISCLSNSLILGPEQATLIFRCDNTDCHESLEPVEAEITISFTIPFCDKVVNTCRLECIIFKFLVECSATATKIANVTLKANVR